MHRSNCPCDVIANTSSEAQLSLKAVIWNTSEDIIPSVESVSAFLFFSGFVGSVDAKQQGVLPLSRCFMNRITLRLLVLGSFAFLSQLSLRAQASFLEPPPFSGKTGTFFVADFNGDGKPDVLCSDGTLNLGNGDGTFKLGTEVSGTPLAVADFNGDGKPDILEQGTGTLLVLLGNGDGTFQPAVATPSGASLTTVAAGDLNGDGKTDVVGVFNDALMVYVSKGDGTFAPGVSYSFGFSSSLLTSILSIGDFNGDQKLDVVATLYDGNGNANGLEIVLLGNGDGTFQAAVSSAGVNSFAYADYVALGDFNGDGKSDLAISTSAECHGGCPPGTVYLLLGNGDGTFQTPVSAFPGSGALIAADVNGDGKLDLVMQTDLVVCQIYLGNGDGTFSNNSNYLISAPFYSSYPYINGLAFVDFNLDGKPDLAVGNAVLLGNGNGTFQGIPFALSVTGPFVIGDFNEGGTKEVALVSPSTVTILSNNGQGTLSATNSYTLPLLPNSGPVGIVEADLNGDGKLDLIINEASASGTGNWGYSVLLGNGDGTFQTPVTYQEGVAGESAPLVIADFNNDSKPDFAVPVGNQTLAVLLGNGDGTFTAPAYYFDAGASLILTGDYNGDGKFDIAFSNYGSGSTPQTGIVFGNGDGTFQAAVFPSSLNGFAAQFVADVNNDGKPDLISSNQVALGNGDGTFRLLATLPYSVVAVGDLNGDGKADLIVDANSNAPNVASPESGVLLGNGDGTFGPFVNLPGIYFGSPGPLISDMNNDGRLDIVFPWATYPSIGSEVSGIAVLLAAPDFSIAPSPTTQTIAAGQTANFSLAFTSSGSFAGTVNLSCAVAPVVTPAPTCSFSSSSVQIGTGPQTVNVSVATTASVTAMIGPRLGFPLSGLLMALIATLASWLSSARTRLRSTALATLFLAVAFVFSISCGGDSGSPTHTPTGTPAGAYSVTVTGASGNLRHNTVLQVIVQ